jgi:hypothetical protein
VAPVVGDGGGQGGGGQGGGGEGGGEGGCRRRLACWVVGVSACGCQPLQCALCMGTRAPARAQKTCGHSFACDTVLCNVHVKARAPSNFLASQPSNSAPWSLPPHRGRLLPLSPRTSQRRRAHGRGAQAEKRHQVF